MVFGAHVQSGEGESFPSSAFGRAKILSGQSEDAVTQSGEDSAAAAEIITGTVTMKKVQDHKNPAA